MNKFSSRLAASMALAIISTSGVAASDSLTTVIGPKVSAVIGTEVEKVMATKHAGLYEVLTPSGMVYTDKAGSFVIFGPIVSTATKENLTDKRLADFSKFNFKDLPFKDAIKTVKGDGSRVIATVEDPNCGYCKRLMQELAKVDNITIYTFVTPILGPESVAKSTAIWCAKNPTEAWNSYMSGAAAAPVLQSAGCDTPFARNAAITTKLRITGTPAILFSDNTKVPGYMTAAALEAKLKANGK